PYRAESNRPTSYGGSVPGVRKAVASEACQASQPEIPVLVNSLVPLCTVFWKDNYHGIAHLHLDAGRFFFGGAYDGAHLIFAESKRLRHRSPPPCSCRAERSI